MNRKNQAVDNIIRFKDILLELHRGADPSTLYDRFHEVITHATADECEEIKQQMLIEGVPRKRTRKWSKHHLKRHPADAHQTN
jgi:DUF438 domain-containing protein